MTPATPNTRENATNPAPLLRPVATGDACMITPNANQPALISLPEAARMLGISRASAYRYAAAGQLPVKKFGRRVYVVRAQLAEFLSSDIVTCGEAA